MERYKVVFLGSGNVATHLAKAIDAHHHVVQVYSRNISNACTLANQLAACEATDRLDDIYPKAHFYIVSIRDDSIKSVITRMPIVDGIVVHTSGSIEMGVLEVLNNPVGVFYPLQTFSKDTFVNIKDIPFFLEASDPSTLAALENLASSLSENIYHANSQERQTLHLAAVFACNFFNHMLDISNEILNDKGYSLDVLEPLIRYTFSKALKVGPYDSQTGPAVRGDFTTINKHLSLLDDTQKEIYQLISQSIIVRHKIQIENE